MKKLIYISLLFLTPFIIQGQASNFLTNDYVLPPPEATSFMKFVGQPVDYFTGSVPINIPIHTINEGSLSVPITLSYHTGGVRVDEIAGWTGINWNLSVGGNLSRTVRGLPDELENSAKGYQISGNILANNGGIDGVSSGDIVNGYFDTEADIFSFSAGGYSGKFYFDRNGNVVMTKGESITVVPSKEFQSYLWNKFVLTTPDGNRYYFGVYQGRKAYETQWTTDNFDEDIQLGGQSTTPVFHLLAIENHSGDFKIEYFYDLESYKYPQKKTCTYQAGTLSNSCSTSSIDPSPCNSGDTNDYFIQHIEGYKLTKILTQSEEVNFFSVTYREDLEIPYGGTSGDGADYLQRISINNDVIKDVTFSYSYFKDGSSTKSYHKRLRLDSLVESSGGNSLPPYKFEYFSDFLPNRFSNSIDHWGFYNGQVNNYQYNIPETTITYNGNEITFGQSNRKAYSEHVNTGMLTKVTYPTGGTRSFDYENHTTFTNSETSQQEFHIKDCGDELDPLTANICESSSTGSSIVRAFKQNEIETGYIDVMVAFVNPGIQGDPGQTEFELQGILELKPPSGSSIYDYTYLTVPQASLSINETKKVKLNDLSGIQADIDYIVSIKIETTDPNEDEEGWASATYFTYPLLNEIVGGARIQKITTNDGYSEYERIFEYNDKSGLSSGILYQKPVYGNNYTGSSGSLGWSVNTWSDAVLFPFNSYSGSYIGYGEVVEKTQNNGKINRKYHALQNQTLQWPLIPTQPKALNGKIKSSQMINEVGYTVAYTTNLYGGASLPQEQDDIWDMYAIEKLGPFPDCNGSQAGFVPLHSGYDPIQIKNVIKKSISNQDNVETTTDYSYDLEANHLYPIAVKTCDLEKNCYTQKSRYLDDYTLSLTAQNYFDANNMYFPAWETKKIKGEASSNTEISGSRTRWSNFGGNNYRPYLFQTLNADGSWKEMARITQYNTDGFPETMTRRDKAHEISLSWRSGSQFGLLDNITEHQRVIQYDYEGGRKLKSILDNNAIESTFDYDNFNRLDVATSNNGRISVDYDYTYGLAYGNENIISSTPSYLDGTASQTVNKIFDGLGRPKEERRLAYTQSGSDFILSRTYNELGNIISSTDPASGGTTTFELEHSPLNRVLETNPPGSDQPIVNAYGSNTLNIGGYSANTLYKSSITDENGNTSVTYTDIFGRQIATVIDEGGLNLMTTYTYNDRDQVLTIQPPSGDPYVYTYYTDGLLKSKTVPDKGTTTYTYNQYDQIEKEELPNGKKLEYVYHNDYNSFLEAVKLDGQTIKSYEPDDPTLVKEWVKEESLAIHSAAGIELDGHVTEYLDFDYNFGRPRRIDVSTLDGSTSTILEYDNPGNITFSETTISGPDGIGRVVTNEPTYHKGMRQVSNPFEVDGLKMGVESMSYNDNDWLTQKMLTNAIQTIDYQYNTRGWLTNINSIESTYITGDPCNDDITPTDEIDCDKLINVVQTFMIYYNCLKLSSDEPTSLKIKKTTQYFEGSVIANGVTTNEFDISIGGGIISPNNSFSDSISFTLNGPLDNDDFVIAFVELLIDCINNNPQMLDEINAALLAIIGTNGEIAGDIDTENGETIFNSNEDVFGMEIHYSDGNSELSAIPQYNGNISWMEWRAKSDQRHAYGFQYDGANRLLIANYGEDDIHTEECEIVQTDKYTVRITEYDALGNIKNLIRQGLKDPYAEIPEYGTIDMLHYDYDPNSSSLLTAIEETS
ncbi:MAG: hypothetical protein AAGA77_05575, partial [Bacteroidota bacterium]